LFRQDTGVYGILTPHISEAGHPALDLRSAIADAIGMEDALGALHRFSLLTFSGDARTYRCRGVGSV
jgi:hypothetical protein